MPDPTPNPAEAPQRLRLPGEEEALELLDEARAEEFKPEEDRRGFSITKWADDDPVKAANLADYLIHVHGQAEDLKAQVKAIAQARRDEADAFEKTRLAHIEADQARIAITVGDEDVAARIPGHIGGAVEGADAAGGMEQFHFIHRLADIAGVAFVTPAAFLQHLLQVIDGLGLITDVGGKLYVYAVGKKEDYEVEA